MDTTFNLKRIGYMLRADLMEQKLFLLFGSLTCVAIWALLCYNSANDYVRLFYSIWVILTVLFCGYAGRKLHSGKGLYLTLPASTTEKYAALMAEGALLFGVYNLLFWIGAVIGRLLAGYPMVDYHSLYTFPLMQTCGYFFFTFSILFYFFTFRRMPLLLYIASYVLFVTILINVAKLFYPMVMGEKGILEADTNSLMDPETPYWAVALVALTVLFFCLSYVQLKRKQLR